MDYGNLCAFIILGINISLHWHSITTRASPSNHTGSDRGDCLTDEPDTILDNCPTLRLFSKATRVQDTFQLALYGRSLPYVPIALTAEVKQSEATGHSDAPKKGVK